jgi:hypothetical protein
MKLTQKGCDPVVGRGSGICRQRVKKRFQCLTGRDRRALGILDLTAVPPEQFG